MDVGDDAAASDGRLDERVELLISADRELQVTGSDALHLEVLARVAGELEDLGGEVLEDGGGVDRRRGADALAALDGRLEEPVDTADGELKSGLGRPGLRRLLGRRGLATLASLSTLASFARLRRRRVGLEREVRDKSIWYSIDTGRVASKDTWGGAGNTRLRLHSHALHPHHLPRHSSVCLRACLRVCVVVVS